MKKVHLVGICGIAMGTLACMLKEKGYTVTGSDLDTYPPMSDILLENGIEIIKGYKPGNVEGSDLVVIGNAISRGNPEVETVLDLRVPYISMTNALYEFFLKDKIVIAVTGTHGKSTTSALLAHILEKSGESPSFFIGGVLNNYNSNYKLGEGKYFIIEGDEYDSAYFEKVPKFMFYRPNHLIINSIEFDHADIYNNLDEILLWFRRLVNIIPSKGNIVYPRHCANSVSVIDKAFSKKFSFGNHNSDYNYNYEKFFEGNSYLEIKNVNHGSMKVKSTLMGDYNYNNIAAASTMALNLGIDKEKVAKALESFQGVRRRQQLIYNKKNIKIYEDFAHHPTAIRYFLDTMKRHYSDSKIWAVYEPRSATSRRNIFQDELPSSFKSADRIIIKNPYKLNGIPEGERLNLDKIIGDINIESSRAVSLDTVEDIIKYVVENINYSQKNVIAIMSNGGFDGIYDKIKVEINKYDQ